MGKLTDKQKKKIIADYAITQNKSKTAKMNNVTETTVRRLLKSSESEVIQKVEQKKEENIQDTLAYMQEQHETKKRILFKILTAIEKKADKIDDFTNIKDLAMAYGIIIDKDIKIKETKSQEENPLNKINDNILNLAELINNPKENRKLPVEGIKGDNNE